MCDFLFSTEEFIRREKPWKGLDSTWSPLKANSCCRKKQCSDCKMLEQYLIKFFINQVKDGVSQDRKDEVLDSHLREEQRAFSEYQRILNHGLLTPEERTRLLAVPTKVAVTDFLNSVFEFSAPKAEIIIYTCILMKRLLKVARWTLKSTNWRIIFIICLRVAQKLENHPPITTNDLCIIYPLFRRAEFANLEILFVKILDYKFRVSYQEFLTHLHQMIPQKRFDQVTRAASASLQKKA
eukprot:CAMPEP_0115008660 /NCGR_PEP_ID=MMETSP0216-20121206/22078_1 /TAXON_ID=223996 /ORGANISM="Protocruzia adherens, Strain Boccale" /LENGTH=238 /DNA_ID=CAMNT_0002376177 /DNA_START=111 /DNA_END=827 /DNA_ORIENTATION=+